MCQGLMLVFLLMMSSSWAGEVYRWQDGAGVWHFGGPQSAPVSAKPFVAVMPISVIESSKPTAYGYVQKMDESERLIKVKVSKAEKRAEKIPHISERAKHQDYCEKWRERLYRSRLGLRDHENQAAYERECILKVHW